MHATTSIWTGNGTLCAYIVKTTTYRIALRERESLNGITITSQYIAIVSVHGAAYTNNMISMQGMSDLAHAQKVMNTYIGGVQLETKVSIQDSYMHTYYYSIAAANL